MGYFDNIDSFDTALAAANWPHRVTVSDAVFYAVRERLRKSLTSISDEKGGSEISFQYEVTKVCLANPVIRPGMVDMTAFEFAPTPTVDSELNQAPEPQQAQTGEPAKVE